MKITDIINTTATVKKPKLKQKKWIPPLQQMLDLMKQNQTNVSSTVTQVDPTVSLAESIDHVSDIYMCEECGKLNLPEQIDESAKDRITEKWDILRARVIGATHDCDKH
jgi:hypothetical protein